MRQRREHLHIPNSSRIIRIKYASTHRFRFGNLRRTGYRYRYYRNVIECKFVNHSNERAAANSELWYRQRDGNDTDNEYIIGQKCQRQRGNYVFHPSFDKQEKFYWIRHARIVLRTHGIRNIEGHIFTFIQVGYGLDSLVYIIIYFFSSWIHSWRSLPLVYRPLKMYHLKIVAEIQFMLIFKINMLDSVRHCPDNFRWVACRLVKCASLVSIYRDSRITW